MWHRSLFLCALVVSSCAYAQKPESRHPQGGSINVVTRQNDNQHTGQNLQETILTPSNVNSNSFGKLFSYPVDGQIYAQPLYVQNLTMASGGTHNVVFVATEYDSVYAFDADSAALNPTPLWHVNFLNPPSVYSVPCAVGAGICQLFPIVGITATPVINLATNTMYVLVRTQEVSGSTTNSVQRIHALDITSGAEQPGSPVVICSATGNKGCYLGNQGVVFAPQHQESRDGMLLVPTPGFSQGLLLMGFSGDSGWLLAYDAATLNFVAAFYTDNEQTHTTTKKPGIPGEGHSGIWAGGAGIVTDLNNTIYAITGDGYFDGVTNWGDALVKLSLNQNTNGTYSFVVTDYFTPSDQACRYAQGLDYGSAGPLILPTQPGATYPDLIFTTGKAAKSCDATPNGYIVNLDNMGHQGGQVSLITAPKAGTEGSPAFWTNGTTQWIYNGGEADSLRAFTVSTAGVSTSSVMQSKYVFNNGTSPVISANGTTNGIVWALDRTDDSDILPGTAPIILHAFDATNLSNELYNSTQAPSGRDTAGPSTKYQVPTVANGKVYVPSQTELDVYGLCPCARK